MSATDPKKAIEELRKVPGVIIRSEMFPMNGTMGLYISVEPEALAFARYQRAARGGPLYPAPAVALGCINVSFRAGELWTVDGQNRAKRLMKVPRSERSVRYLEAQCYLLLTEAEEAAMFSVMNHERRQLRAAELLNGRIFAQDSEAEEVVAFAAGLGLEVAQGSSNHATPRRIRAVDCLFRLWKSHRDVLEATLVTLRDVWPDDEKKYHHNILRSLSAFLRRFGGHANFSHGVLLAQLRKHKTSQAFVALLPAGCERTRISTELGMEVFTKLYNDGRRGDFLPQPHELPAPLSLKSPLLMAGD